jgi:hypothetical protein
MKDKIRQWILYNTNISFWVVYTPKFKGGMYQIKDSYLGQEGCWTENPKEAKRYWNCQDTVNRWTKSKKITL